jgi:hypothetical protein
MESSSGHTLTVETRGPVQGATPSTGDMESPNVPKQPCNLTININKELFLSWLDDIAKFDMMMVRMG